MLTGGGLASFSEWYETMANIAEHEWSSCTMNEWKIKSASLPAKIQYLVIAKHVSKIYTVLYQLELILERYLVGCGDRVRNVSRQQRLRFDFCLVDDEYGWKTNALTESPCSKTKIGCVLCDQCFSMASWKKFRKTY